MHIFKVYALRRKKLFFLHTTFSIVFHARRKKFFFFAIKILSYSRLSRDDGSSYYIRLYLAGKRKEREEIKNQNLELDHNQTMFDIQIVLNE